MNLTWAACAPCQPCSKGDQAFINNLYMAKHFRTGHLRSDSTEPTTFSCLLPSTCCTFQNKAGPIFPVLKLHKHTYFNYPLRQMVTAFCTSIYAKRFLSFPIPTLIRSNHKNISFVTTLHTGAKCPHGSLKAELMKQQMSTTSWKTELLISKLVYKEISAL